MSSKVKSKEKVDALKKAHSILLDEEAVSELVLENGPERTYPRAVLSDKIVKNRLETTTTEKLYIAALIALALLVRCSHLELPNSVVFDEVHFGGFASKYIQRTFFMDVHPPLAKLLYAGISFLAGFSGQFQFSHIGDEFPNDVPYVVMRQFSAFTGVGTILLTYLTLRATGCKPITSLVTAGLLLFESANATISRYILLDSPLLFFIAAATYSYAKLEASKPFSGKWYKALFATGISLGCAVSSKWVGLFTIAWVAGANVVRLFLLAGDLKVSAKSIWKQGILRVFVLIGSILTIYLAAFYVHFSVLVKDGDAANFMSSRFRSDLDSARLPEDVLADVGVSSIVTLKHYQGPESYLHSHDALYPSGSKQQQVTLYPYRDDNNKWTIELYNLTSEPLEFVPITDNTKIRLKHLNTARRLHAHDLRPVVSEIDWQDEATCYGFEGFEGDPNDDFVVEIYKPLTPKGEAQERVIAMQTVFKLHHAMTGCCLFSHDVHLPEWGFDQTEVTCAKQGIDDLELWYVEENENMYLDHEDAPRISYKHLSFWEKFVELNTRMWKVNEKLTQTHPYESSPGSWPLLSRGISYWKKDNGQIYFLGNPSVWYLASFLFVPFALVIVTLIIRYQYGFDIKFDAVLYNYAIWMSLFVLGWFVHYFPSFLMGRQMFLHHYLPALWFGILALGQTLELVNSYIFKGRFYAGYVIYAALLATTIFSFLRREPLVSGKEWNSPSCKSSKLFNGWDYECDIYPEEAPKPVKSIPESKPTLDFNEAVKIEDVKSEAPAQPEAIPQDEPKEGEKKDEL